MKIQHKIVVLSIIAGVLFWIMDAVLGFFFFYEGTFWELLIFNVPAQAFYIRWVGIITFLALGLLISKIITMHKRAEEKVQREQERAKKYLDIANIMLVVIDTDQKVNLINKKGCEILGYKEKEIIGKNWFDHFLPEKTRNEVRAFFIKLITEKSEQIGYFCNPVLPKSGQERIIKWYNTVLYEEKGKIVGVLSSGTDVTECKLAVDLLKESEGKYSTLVEQARDGVVFIQDGVYKFANKAITKITGYAIEELVGKCFSDVIAAESRNLMVQRYELIMSGKEIPTLRETKVMCKGGAIKDVEVSPSDIQYQGKQGVIGIVRDITERKKMEEEIQKVQKLESIGALAGGIAHDFNNLLTAIMGNLSLAELYLKSGGNISEVLEEIKKSSQQAKNLTQQLLTFSKGGAPIKKKVSIEKLLKDAPSLTLSGSNVRCEFFIPDDLWWAEVDEGQINQVINNVMINADQAMPEGGVIKVSAENMIIRAKDGLPLKEGKYVKILLKDQGEGIQKEHLQKIFDPFFTTKQKGRGLGLAIAYSIIKKHKGHITVESKVGVGSTFTIFLPALERKIFKVKEIVEERLCSGKGKILFMDDRADIRHMVRQMLTFLGYQVTFAGDGAEAIELYEKAKKSGQAFDAVILDLTVPGGMGGKEAIQKLHEVDPLVKAIVSSGYCNDPIMANYKQYGFKGAVAKPFEIKELSKTLHRVIMGMEETIDI